MKRLYEVFSHIILWVVIVYLIYYFLDKIGTYSDTNIGRSVLGIRFYGQRFLIIIIAATLMGPLLAFYIFYLWLIPKFFLQKKFLLFFVIALVSSFIIGYLFRLTFSWGEAGELRKIFSFTIFALICGVIGGAFKGFFLWLRSMTEKKELEKRNLESQNALLLLKAQLNPHFLFNSLNNIDILIEEQPKTASEYLKKLADILRYVLYETNDVETEFSKELEQIKNYIDLQKIRTDNPKYVNFIVRGDLRDQKIASMIFLPLIENAFKFSKNKTIDNAVDICFEINNDFVKMSCTNHYEENQIEVLKNEGLGLETVKKRLKLLYPERHEMKIIKDNNRFSVSLNIELENVN